MAEPENFPSRFLPVDPRTKNIAGYQSVEGITKAGDEYETATKEAMDALRERYSTPNWGKVAAAFGRPHLGGAFEALGDVGNVLGEHLEQARDAKVNLAQMRAQLAAYKYPVEQQKEAERIYGEAWKNPGGPTPEQTANINRFSGTPAGEALGQGRAAAEMKIQSAIAILRSGLDTAKTALSMNKIDRDTLTQILNNPAYRNMAETAGVVDVAQSLLSGNPNAPTKPLSPVAGSGGVNPSTAPTPDSPLTPPGVPKSLLEQVQQGVISPDQYQARVKEYSDTYNKDRNALGSIKNNSQSVFNTAVKAYGIASKPSLRQYLGIGRSGKISDLAIQIMQGSALGKIFGDSPSAVKKQWNMSDADFTDLNNLAREMANLKALSAMNPAGSFDPDQKFANQTDFRTELETMANPSMSDSHMSLLKGLAMMASKAKMGIEAPAVLSSFVQNRNNDINDFKSSAELYDLGEQHKARSTDILDKYPAIDPKTGRYQKPSWFESKSSGTSSGSSRPQELETANGRLVKINGKWFRRP